MAGQAYALNRQQLETRVRSLALVGTTIDVSCRSRSTRHRTLQATARELRVAGLLCLIATIADRS